MEGQTVLIVGLGGDGVQTYAMLLTSLGASVLVCDPINENASEQINSGIRPPSAMLLHTQLFVAPELGAVRVLPSDDTLLDKLSNLGALDAIVFGPLPSGTKTFADLGEQEWKNKCVRSTREVRAHQGNNS